MSITAVPTSLASAPAAIPTALHRACRAARIAADNKGQDVLVLDLRPITPLFDFFVISTAASRRPSIERIFIEPARPRYLSR